MSRGPASSETPGIMPYRKPTPNDSTEVPSLHDIMKSERPKSLRMSDEVEKVFFAKMQAELQEQVERSEREKRHQLYFILVFLLVLLVSTYVVEYMYR